MLDGSFSKGGLGRVMRYSWALLSPSNDSAVAAFLAQRSERVVRLPMALLASPQVVGRDIADMVGRRNALM